MMHKKSCCQPCTTHRERCIIISIIIFGRLTTIALILLASDGVVHLQIEIDHLAWGLNWYLATHSCGSISMQGSGPGQL